MNKKNTRSLFDFNQIGDVLKERVKFNGKNLGIYSGLAGLVMNSNDRKSKQRKLKFLKQNLRTQTLEFEMNQGEKDGLLKEIYIQINGMGGKLNELRRSINDKVQQYDGYIQGKLGGMNFQTYMTRFKQNVLY